MKPPTRKRSLVVKLGLTAAVAFAVQCGGPRGEAQRCIDATGRVVEDRYCDQRSGSGGVPYHWYYGGNGFYPGDRATGGADRPSGNSAPVRTSSPEFGSGGGHESGGVSHGGFGATGEGGGAGE